MIKKHKSIIKILFLTLFLNGCWDYKDIDKKSITLSTAIDKIDERIQRLSETAKLTVSDSTSGEKAQIAETFESSAEGKDFEEARLNYNSKIPLEVFMGAQRVVVFSRKFAESGIKEYTNRYYNVQEFRNSALVVVCKEPPSELFSGKVENDISVGYAIENTVRHLNDAGQALYKTNQQIYSDIYFDNIGYLLPYVTKDRNVIEYLGFAVMKDSKLVGTIDLKESNGFLFILSKNPTTTMPIPHPRNKKNLVSIQSKLKKRKIKTTYKNNIVNIKVDIELNSQLLYPYKVETISDNDIKKIEDLVSQEIKKDIVSSIKYSQDQIKCDIFGFARYFKSQNISTYRKIKWEKEYPNARFYVNVKTIITNTNFIDLNAKVQE